MKILWLNILFLIDLKRARKSPIYSILDSPYRIYTLNKIDSQLYFSHFPIINLTSFYHSITLASSLTQVMNFLGIFICSSHSLNTNIFSLYITFWYTNFTTGSEIQKITVIIN